MDLCGTVVVSAATFRDLLRRLQPVELYVQGGILLSVLM